MRNIILFLLCLLVTGSSSIAQYILIDDMEGHGPGSGKWTYYAGDNATGSVIFNAPNPAPSTLNPSSQVAKFVKDTSCFPYMGAACTLAAPLDLTAGATFRMRVYSNVREDVMFKLQPGTDHTQAIFKTYRVQQINQWEEVEFTFAGINHRTDLNRITIQFIDGKKANGILYFDHIEAPNPTSIRLTQQHIAMGAENGKTIEVKVVGDLFKAAINPAHWQIAELPAGVTIGNILRMNDSTVNIVLSGNSPANYSTTQFRLTVDSAALQHPQAAAYPAKGSVVFDGNPNWTLIYADDFEYEGLPDPAKWTIDPRPKAWINGEQQVYTDPSHDNARVRNGNLVITGKKNYPTGDPAAPYSSARVISLGKMEFLYGKAEMRAKLPRARGSWPAFWLMPAASAYGNWPRSGEIDILEHVGNTFGKAMCAVHTENKNWTNGGNLGGNRIMPDLDTVYHVYGVEWSPDSLRFTHDGVGFYTYSNPHTDWKDWPFDKPFYVILNIAMGGGMGGQIVDADWPDSMQVDWVRISQKGLGTPVPDSISITPSNISMLPGKTQPFSAKVLDQNGRVMASVTPTWSITGSGNTINAAGLAAVQSSGVVTATATVDTITITGTTNVHVRPTNYKPIPARIEAEDFDNSNVCCNEPTADTSGGVNVSYIASGSWFEYDIDVPDSAAYRIRFRVAVNTPASLSIFNDTDSLGSVWLPASGGWQSWATVTSAPMVFGPGQKTIRLRSNLYGWNFNWLQFVPADQYTVESILVQPDSVRLFAGASVQLKALGYDADSNVIMLPPSATWSVSPGGAQVTSDGLFSSHSTGLFIVTVQAGTLSGNTQVNVVSQPVLSRIAIVPDTLMVPLNASQQFTAKGYDQYNTPVPLVDTIVWSVTGSQNAVSPTGLLTAGSIAGTFQLSAASAGVTGSLNVAIGYGCSVKNRYEAESSSSRAPGLTPVPTDDTSGVQHFEGVTAGKWFAYSNLKVPSAGKYTIRLRVSATAPATIRIGHGTNTFKIISVPSTGGAWQTISDTLTLPALSYTGIHGASGSFRFNWFVIDNCTECMVNNKYEAESVAFRHSGPALEACSDAGDGQNFTGLAPGHWFAYNTLNVPTAGLYRISFRVATTAPAQLKVGHSTFNFGIKSIPSTGGLWQTITDTITLPALSYTGIHVVSGSPKFNWFSIDDCPAGSSVSARLITAIPTNSNATAVFPNPATDKVFIVPGKAREITVYDIAGRVIEVWKTTPGSRTITKDISHLNAGVYILTLPGRTIRLIKQ